MPRIIAHIDLDAFFASVEEHDKPYLAGLPVVVGADPSGGTGRGVVSTANYAAREYGIRSATPIRTAWELSERARAEGKPAVAFCASRSARYAEVSEQVFSLIRARAKVVVAAGIDEGYVDLSHHRSFARARAWAIDLKQAVRRETGLVCSVGIAANKMLAKIASDADKPDGLCVVLPRQAAAFLAPRSVRDIPGIGPKTAAVLARHSVSSIGDMQRVSWEQLVAWCGSGGFDLHRKAFGVYESPLVQRAERKSIGEHFTLATDTHDRAHICEILEHQAASIYEKLTRKGFSGFRTTVLTIRFADFETKQRSLTVSDPLTSVDALSLKALKLAFPFFEARENPQHKAIRLVGLRVEHLVRPPVAY